MSPVSPVKTTSLSWEEVAKHDSANDAWLIVRGRVYDVTEWIGQHPGGRDAILLHAGRDATAVFESYHLHDVGALASKQVGTVALSELPTYPEMGAFYKTVRARVQEHFARRKAAGLGGPKDSAFMVCTGLAFFAAIFVFHYLAVWLASHQHLMLATAAAAVAGWGAAMVSLTVVHESSHMALTRSPWAWRLMGALHDFGSGASFYAWLHQHFLGHHPYTNVHEADPDVLTNDPDVRRIKRVQPYHALYTLQALYAPLLYGLLAVKFRVNDLSMYYGSRRNGAIRMAPPSAWHAFCFVAGKIFFVMHRIVVPLILLGPDRWMAVLYLAIIVDLVTSYYLALAFQLSHVVPQAEWPRVVDAVKGHGGRIEADWAELQVRTTVDYAHGGRWTTFLTGALNYQAVHHLFPCVSQAHYHDIAPIVRRTCAEFDIPYVILPDFWTAFKNHLSYLNDLGQNR